MNPVLEKPDMIVELSSRPIITLDTPVLGSKITYRQLYADEAIAVKNQQPLYKNLQEIINYMSALSDAPSLTDMAEIEALKRDLINVAKNKGSIIHAGLCAEDIDVDIDRYVRGFYGLMTQLRGEMKEPVVMIGRFAGQFAKPRSSAYEDKDGVLYPSFRGTNVNGLGLDDRMPSLDRLMRGNYFASNALSVLVRVQRENGDKQKIYASHEGLHIANEIGFLHREVGFLNRNAEGKVYTGSSPMIWIGDRTGDPDGLHVRLGGIVENVIGLKIGANMMKEPGRLDKVLKGINPKNDPAKVLAIMRFSAEEAVQYMPEAVAVMKANGIEMAIADPMHPEIRKDAKTGKKIRDAEAVGRNLEAMQIVAYKGGLHLAGVSLEASGEDVTECIGLGVNEIDLARHKSPCDPCYNPDQAVLELRRFNTRRLKLAA